MNKNKKIMKISILLIIIIFLISLGLSAYRIYQNKHNKSYTLYIYQYQTKNFNFDLSKERSLYKKIDINKDTSYEILITSIDQKYENVVHIENGIVKVIDATCQNKICMDTVINLEEDSILSFRQITCMPSGLFIEIK